MNTEIIIEKAKSIGGRTWEGGTQKRVYLGETVTAPLIGLTYRLHKGRAKGCELNGSKVSNTHGTEILSQLRDSKVFIDCADGSMHIEGTEWSEEIREGFQNLIK